MESSYAILKVTKEFVAIVDLDVGPSVTNTAESVVAKILESYGQRRVLYRDTSGRWDELAHDGHRFVGFKPLPDCFNIDLAN